ncbi:hypothetical protein QMA09_16945 [Planococcus sp. APC 3906]|uniref:hypothetical protein n=1 Tax=Planococcus sp. APC 3906 TaxID=3035194 RepID=UPI0025B3F1E8|nr:hypothetical protein [Planococcus sp. APC 3906]MDN3451880.1 hypothetical protein [Planococcus sp. APC 3906]
MAKIPVNSVVDTVKTYGPKVAKLAYENKELIVDAIPKIELELRKIKERQAEKSKERQAKKLANKVENDNDHFEKMDIKAYKKNTLSKLDNLNRIQLNKHKHEIETFISQIATEEKQALAIKKPLYAKKIKEWNSLLIQVENQIAVMDYHEYFNIYNNPAYESTYFKGSERKIQSFKQVLDEDSTEALFNFIHVQTNRDLANIEKDFL